MKKQFVLTLFLLVALGCCHAQINPAEVVVKPNHTKHFSVGLLGGIDRNYHIVDMSYMVDYKFDKYAPGSTYGLQLGYTPVKWLSLRMDVAMVQKNYNRTHKPSIINIDFYDSVTNQYINIPLVAMLNVGNVVRLHLFGGGYVGYWLQSHHKGLTEGVFGYPTFDEDVDFSTTESQTRDNRLDMGLTYGAGLSCMLFHSLELGAEVRWYYGLQDIQKPYMTNLNPRYNTTFVIQGGISYWM
ncbi:MAG: PorT family protein [Bacteroidales bacterium]|nr:PorT family protein [Bacteroidales bacterium]